MLRLARALVKLVDPRHFREEQLKQVILGGLLGSDRLPIVKRSTHCVDCNNRIASRPNEGVVVIRRVPLFLKLNEGLRYILQLSTGKRLPGTVERLYVILTVCLSSFRGRTSWRGYFAGAPRPNSQPPRRSEDETERSTLLIRPGEDSPVWVRRSPGWPDDTPAPAGPLRMPFLSSARVPRLARACWPAPIHYGNRSTERAPSSGGPAGPLFAT